jgi:hypothetical protein
VLSWQCSEHLKNLTPYKKMTWRKWLPILVGMVVLFSCESDDDDAGTSGVLRFYVQDRFITEEEQYWIIVSNENGTVLDWKPLQNGGTYSYTLPANVNGVVTLTTVKSWPAASPTASSSVVTYTNVPAGTYKFERASGSGTEAFKPAYLELSGFGASDDRLRWISPQATGMLSDTSDTDTGLRLELIPFAQKMPLLAILNDDPTRYLYTEVESGKTAVRNVDDFAEFTTQTIGIPTGTTLSFVTLTGINAYGEFLYYFKGLGVSPEVPTIPVFDAYALQASLDDPINNLTYSLRLTGALPDEFPRLESSLLDVTAKDDMVSWKTSTANLDAVNVVASKYESAYDIQWTLVGDGGEQSIALPRIPDGIPLTGVPARWRSFTTLAKDGMNVSLLNFPHYNGYQDYLRKHFLYTMLGNPPEDFLETSQFVTPK